MLKRLLERLEALGEVSEGIRSKANSRQAKELDGLSVARVLVAVDAAVTKLCKLNDQLKPGLFDDRESA